MNFSNEERPIIIYPCEWGYKVIGTDEVVMQNRIEHILGNRHYSLVRSKTSAQGKYISLEITLTVANEDERNSLFQDFTGIPSVKMVI